RLGKSRVLLLLFSFQLLKKCDKRLRIVAGAIAILQAEHVSLALSIATEFQIAHWQRQANSLSHSVSNRAAHKDQRYRRQIKQLRARVILGDMPRRYVRNLMRHP